MPREDVESMLDDMDDDVVDTSDATGSVSTEVTEDSVLDELSAFEGELTIEQLKKLPGADKHSDEELEQMWKRVSTPRQRSYKLYKDDKPLEDFSGLTAEELLDAVKYGYTANGKEQVKNFDELVRVAQMGHYNESRMQQILNERNQKAEAYAKLEAEHSTYGQERKLWEHALSRYLQGDQGPLTQIIEAYQKAINEPPQLANNQPESDTNLEAAAQKVYYEVVIPNSYNIASKYGANPQEVANAVLHYVNQEPPEFMNEQRLAEILNHDIPMLLEQNGYSANTHPMEKPKDELAELKRELAELKAAQTNNTVNGAKKRKAPPAGGGATPSGSDTMPDVKSRADMKKFLRDE